jgi:DNA-binding transcriptional LysR family regulator
MRIRILAVLLGLAGCGDFPRDVEGTSERVAGERRFRAAIAAGTPGGEAQTLIARVARATGTRPELSSGTTEPLLKALEAGELDLVVAPMERKSPWKTMVHFLPPLARDHPGDGIDLVAMARNGENRWIGRVDREARAIGGDP